MTVRDFDRFGELMRRRGDADGRQIVPSDWVRDATTGVARQAWINSNFASWLPHGNYRNQSYQSGNADDAFFALGSMGKGSGSSTR